MKMSKNKPDWNQLNSQERYVIIDKGTEYPFSGEYNDFKNEGPLFVGAASTRCIQAKVNLILVAVGQVLMMRLKVM